MNYFTIYFFALAAIAAFIGLAPQSQYSERLLSLCFGATILGILFFLSSFP